MKHVKRLAVMSAMGLTLLTAVQPASALPDGDGAKNRNHAAIAERRQARMEERFQKLKMELKVAPQQEAQWQTFVATVQQQMADARSARGQFQPNLTAPERMNRRIGLTEQRLAGMQKVSASLNDLYAVLTPEQRAVLDQHAARQHHFGRHAKLAPTRS